MPTVSVILPVYNGERFLREAIDSILAQTFTDFEFLLLNDGSTDGSEAIIQSYTDPRIVYVKNERNEGLINTLNKALDLARGEYVARMDADDASAPERLQVQKAWLDQNPETAVVASFSTETDEDGKPLGFFAPDRRYVTAPEIRRRLPRMNCLTHPSIMARAAVLKEYRYAANQKNIEDYDLWLRLAADGFRLEKIPQPLLLYRVHGASVTQTKLRSRNFFVRHFHCKRRYLARRLKRGRLTVFDFCVASEMVLDAALAAAKRTKEVLTNR